MSKTTNKFSPEVRSRAVRPEAEQYLRQHYRSAEGEMPCEICKSVLRRIANNAHSYAPKGLPARYEVVTTQGEVLAPHQNPYETETQAQARLNFQEKVWNTIWLRRIVYFMTED